MFPVKMSNGPVQVNQFITYSKYPNILMNKVILQIKVIYGVLRLHVFFATEIKVLKKKLKFKKNVYL